VPLVKVIRRENAARTRGVPTATCATLLPMTLDRAHAGLVSRNEEPVAVTSLRDAFEKFKPRIEFIAFVGERPTEFRAEFRFTSIQDFDPESLQKHHETVDDPEPRRLPNDLADLKDSIDLLCRLKRRWQLPAVRRAWANPEHRNEIIAALARLRVELERLSEEETAAQPEVRPDHPPHAAQPQKSFVTNLIRRIKCLLLR
jgi:type VI secretion system protein ImpB